MSSLRRLVAMNKQQRVYAILRERVLSGTYGPGYRLVIDRLAEELEVSALPVREAVRRLEAEGLAVFRPNAGAQVTPADPALYEEGLTVLAVLEGYATAEAAPRMGEAELAGLEQETDAMVACMETLDVLGFSEANQRFHERIHAHCGNAYLLGALEDSARRLDAIRRTVFTHIPYRGVNSIQDHREIVALIRSRAPREEIERAAREHKLRTVEAFREWRREHPRGRVTGTRRRTRGGANRADRDSAHARP